jgi:hypothetical protein
MADFLPLWMLLTRIQVGDHTDIVTLNVATVHWALVVVFVDFVDGHV